MLSVKFIRPAVQSFCQKVQMMNRTAAANTSSKNVTGSSTIVPSKAEGIAFSVAFIFSFLAIVIGNLLTIVLFAVNRRLRKRSLFLVINMAFSDLMIGAASLPIYIYSVGLHYQLWTGRWPIALGIFSVILNSFLSQASLISAAFISGERFYALYWPFKHRTLSMRAYRIIILTIWALALLITTIFSTSYFLISYKPAVFFWMPYFSILIFIICGCNMGIWRKFRLGNITSQQNRDSINKRLTKTLLFVSLLALFSLLPLVIFNCLILLYNIQIPPKYYYLASVINYSNSFANPVVYGLRIPEFREALVLCCLRRPAAPNIADITTGNKHTLGLTPATELRTF